MLTEIHVKSKMASDKITYNEEVRRRCEVENLVPRLRKTRLRWFGHVKRRVRIA